MTNCRRAGVALAGLALALCGLHSPASATGGIFDNCTNFNEKFAHGVGPGYLGSVARSGSIAALVGF